MAVTVRSIQGLKDEVYAGGGNNDMAHYGQLWFGRNNCNLNEFLGKSWWKSVYIGFTNTAWVNFTAPDRGGHAVRMFAGSVSTTGGDEFGNGATTTYNPGVIQLTNTGAWNSFNYVNITGGFGLTTFNINKASFFWDGTAWQASVAYPGPIYGATMFYAPI
jgi:hypothetical protein